MRSSRRWLSTGIAVLIFLGFGAAVRAQRAPSQSAGTLSCGDMEAFLKTAKIGSMQPKQEVKLSVLQNGS